MIIDKNILIIGRKYYHIVIVSNCYPCDGQKLKIDDSLFGLIRLIDITFYFLHTNILIIINRIYKKHS